MENNEEVINSLFESAKVNGGFDYLLTLLRVSGMESYDEDPVISFSKLLENYRDIDELTLLKSIAGSYIWLSVVSNLTNCSKGLNYRPLTFELKFPETEMLERQDNLYLRSIYRQMHDEDTPIKNKFHEVFGDKLFADSETDLNAISKDYLGKRIEIIVEFTKDFMSVYKQVLHNFKSETGYTKLPNFDTLEILKDEVKGLRGFKIYFSNGSSAEFKRTDSSTKVVNLYPTPKGISFFVGDLDKRTSHWTVGDTPLYQIGANGRYNEYGEWKPLVYPGPTEALETEVNKLLCEIDDPKRQIRGCLKYIVATCHKHIEFIIKSNFELPHQPTTYSSDIGDMYLHRIELEDQISNLIGNQRFYDCSFALPDVSAEAIQQALLQIQYAVNALVFAVDGRAEWYLKYSDSLENVGVIPVQDEYIAEVNKYLGNEKLSSEDRIRLAAAISWFINGSNSTNVFTSYLCFYIAFEGIASSLAKGEMDISSEYGFNVVPKNERRAATEACIKALHDKQYEHNPKKFVEDAYFDCIISINAHTKAALDAVFGKDHRHSKDFYKKTRGVSVSSLRSKLAHGEFALIDTEHENEVREKLPVLRSISHEFLSRISQGLKPEDKVTNTLGSRSLTMSFSDPRSTGIANSLDMFPTKDWKIRPEWLL